MRNSNRAERRHQIDRLKAKRRNYWGYPNRWAADHQELPVAPEPMSARQLGKVVQYPQACSCAGCCNVRRAPNMNDSGQGLTRQEQRHIINGVEQLGEWYDRSTENLD